MSTITMIAWQGTGSFVAYQKPKGYTTEYAWTRLPEGNYSALTVPRKCCEFVAANNAKRMTAVTAISRAEHSMLGMLLPPQ